MSNIDYIINLCHDLQKQGKTPSVAQIRNVACKPLTIPEVIKAVKYFKANPDMAVKQSTSLQKDKKQPSQTLEQRVVELETQLAQVISELVAVKSQLK